MSPIILPDTSEAEDLDPSEAGTYHAKIVKTDAKLTDKAKVMQAIIQFQLNAVPDEAQRKPRDIKRTAWLNISGFGSMGWDRLLRCTGFEAEADQIRSGVKTPFDTDMLLGKEVLVVLKVGTFNDRRRDEIANFLPANGQGTAQ